MPSWKEFVEHVMHPHRGAPAGEGPYLIVGLGNPGREYEGHRHNVGYQTVDYIARQHHIEVKKRRFKALWGEGEIAGRRVILAKPLTFMNESGQAVGPLSRYYKVPPERLIVIYDDIDLAFGKIRVRPGGSSGGHNGIKSLIQHLGNDAFIRIRIGIGRPAFGDPADYVLHDFSPDQRPVIEQAYAVAEEIVLCILTEGVHQAMNRYNGRKALTVEGAAARQQG